ncbi:hypothetical protein ACQW5G_00935 [Fructilactobacillus sp. Tb1]|uniref:hypothetical protein n=1 Tax=Fructilactobacillus sp. Tb1 TaxID=3422304 RepID=UPI003D2AAEDF
MKMIFEICVGVIIALIIYEILHRIFVVNPEKKYQTVNKDHVDADVFKMISDLQTQKQNINFTHFISSTVQTDVWGRGVMVYEYKYQIETDLELLKIRFVLEGSLSNQMRLENKLNHKLMITDCWLIENTLTFDVADEQNDATEEYIKDIKKIDQK